MSENNDTSNESNSIGSDSILQSSRLTSGLSGLAGGAPLIRGGVLRPSVLAPSVLTTTNNASAFNTQVSSNPFMRDEKNEDNEAVQQEAGAVGGSEENADNATADKKQVDDEEPDERPDPLTMLRKNGLERSNLFAAARNSIPRVEKSGFVFGQNLRERVVGENIAADVNTNADTTEAGAVGGALLFSSVIENANKAAETAETDGTVTKENETKTLTDAAREYEESRAQKRKYEEVKTVTGEEDETNIVDISCKLFAFVNSNWEERGRGSLRLNDAKMEQECSRVVFRTCGNLRVLLNTNVWAGMVAERPSQKSLRLTAIDNTGKIKIFLVMSRPSDIQQLHAALTHRIEMRKLSHPAEGIAANNGTAGSNNGAAAIVDEDSQQAAAAATAPDVDDSEPSPKKALAAGTEN